MLYNEAFVRDRMEMFNDAVEKLSEKTEISDFSEGSVVKSILDVFYDDLDQTRRDFVETIPLFQVSKSSGEYLDEIGKLFDCDRLPDESDDNYRYRIVQQSQELAKANETAIELGCLAVEGVHDILIRDYVRGTGTFDVYVITEDPITPNSVVDNVQEKIEEIEAKGIDGRAVRPKTIPFDLSTRYIFYPDTGQEQKNNIKHSGEEKVREYVENLTMGQDLVISEIKNELMNIDREAVRNVEILRMFLDNKETLISDKEFTWNERVYPQEINIR